MPKEKPTLQEIQGKIEGAKEDKKRLQDLREETAQSMKPGITEERDKAQRKTEKNREEIGKDMGDAGIEPKAFPREHLTDDELEKLINNLDEWGVKRAIALELLKNIESQLKLETDNLHSAGERRKRSAQLSIAFIQKRRNENLGRLNELLRIIADLDGNYLNNVKKFIEALEKGERH